jgi:hypothetical protein
MIEMTPPPGWILARAMAAHLRPVQNRLDAAPHARRRLRPSRPDGFENLDYQSSIDRCDRQLANHRIHVGLQRRGPLSPMHGIAPAGLMGCDIALGAFPERHLPSRGF